MARILKTNVIEVRCTFCPDLPEPLGPNLYECPTCGFRYDASGRPIPENGE